MSYIPHLSIHLCPATYLHSVGLLLVFALPTMAQSSYQLAPRWGAASVYIPSPPNLLLQGGKIDSSSSSYNAAISSTDLISISLSSSFDITSPPASLLTSSPGPAYAWHTLSRLDDGTLLLFGGDAEGSEPVETTTNSAWTLTLNDTMWTHQGTDWAGEPMRRIYHSAVSSGDKVYITGGLKNDGSGQAFADVYVFDAGTKVFQPMVPLPSGLYHHSSVLLPNGTLVVLGGMAIAPDTGNPATVDLSTLYVLDTTVDAPAWSERDVAGDTPAGRRGASLVLDDAGDAAFLFGGADAALSEALGDGWNLDLTSCTWTKSLDSSDVAGRFDHTAVSVGGDQILIVGGCGSSGPVDAAIHLWNMQSSAWKPSFAPLGSAPGSSSGTTGHLTTSEGITVYTSDGHELTATFTSGGAPAASGQASGEPLPTGFDNGAGPGHLTSSQRVAIGVAAGALLLAAAGVTFLLARRRRNRNRQRFGASSYAPSHLWEKGRPDHGESDKSSWGRKALAAGYAVTNKFGSRGRNDKYAVLGDPRRATLLGRDGVVLRSPKSPAKHGQLKYTPSKIRRDMLGDEDFRRFATIPEEDWVTEKDDGTWRPARSLLGSIHNSTEDPFEEPSSPVAPRPVIPHGPVPTPRDSRADLRLDPFDDFRAAIPDHLDQYESALDDAQSATLLAPPPQRARPLSDQSISRSYASRSTSASDLEEGVVGEAQFGLHHQPTLLSPEHGQSVKRTQSFFQRMAQGGVSFLRQPTASQSNESPAPVSRLLTSHREDDADSIDGDEDELAPPRRYKHTYTASLTSIDSVRSMRDMVIVQRQESHSSAEDVIIERADGETPPRHLYHHRHRTSNTSLISRPSRVLEEIAVETVSSIGADVDFGGDGPDLSLSLPAQSTPPRLPQDTPAGSMKSRESGATVSDQSVSSTTTFGTPFPSPSHAEARNPGEIDTHPRATNWAPTPTPGPVPAPRHAPTPSPAPAQQDSPAASPFDKRRPVKDLVNSINKRGNATPMSLFSPTSQYSPLTAAPPSPVSVAASGSPRSATSRIMDRSPIKATFTGESGMSSGSADQVTPKRAIGRPLSLGGSGRSGSSIRSGGSGRPKTIYEAVKRERLSVANPDASR